MCQQTRGTVHKCGHPRTRELFERCAASWRTGIPCMNTLSPLRTLTMCYDCEGVERATVKILKRHSQAPSLADQIVLPETSETGALKARAAQKERWAKLSEKLSKEIEAFKM